MAVLLILPSYSEVLIMDGLDAYFDRMLDTYLEEYFTDAEDEQEGLEDDCSLGLYVGEDQ